MAIPRRNRIEDNVKEFRDTAFACTEMVITVLARWTAVDIDAKQTSLRRYWFQCPVTAGIRAS